ncbi:hypothetical protein C2E23DRAFT_880023 [Lenzites betulinus]|nr:hypothetical protein C2E23DRAFT_880023 [Lenzites betulinus]
MALSSGSPALPGGHHPWFAHGQSSNGLREPLWPMAPGGASDDGGSMQHASLAYNHHDPPLPWRSYTTPSATAQEWPFMYSGEHLPSNLNGGWNTPGTRQYTGPGSAPSMGTWDGHPSPPWTNGAHTFDNAVPQSSSWHLPGVERAHSPINKTDNGTAQATLLPYGCTSIEPCAHVTHACFDYAYGQSTALVPNTQNIHQMVNHNLPDWQPQLGNQPVPVQGRWPQDVAGPAYPQPGVEDELSPDIEGYQEFAIEPATWMEANTRNIHVATSNGLQFWQPNVAVHPTPTQDYWAQDAMGAWYPHPGYQDDAPFRHTSTGSSSSAAPYEDFEAPTMGPDSMFPHGDTATTYQIGPAIEPDTINDLDWLVLDMDQLLAKYRPKTVAVG